ncbi:MAG: transglutaminase domain-containing protein [Acutalibacteraceae bacterium]
MRTVSYFHYVADKDSYFSLMADMSAEIHSVTTPDGGSMQLFYVMRQWEEIYNEQNADSEDWWQDSYTRTETTYNGFDCWVYYYNNSSEKTYYVIKDSNVCIYSRDYSSGVVKDVSMKEIVYNADTSDMTSEELAEWSSTHLKAEEIGSVKNLTFSKEKPQSVAGYRVEVVHHGEPDEIAPVPSWNTRYEWLGSSAADDRYRFSIVCVGQGELYDYDDSFTDYKFRLQPIESDKCYLDHWELYNPETGEYAFYSFAETVDLNYINVTKDSGGNIISRSDYRIGDVLRFRGIYKEKTYHVKVTGGTFCYQGSEKLSEGDVPVTKSITLEYDYDTIPEGYGFDYFKDQNDNKLYSGSLSGISITEDTEYTAYYYEYQNYDTTYRVNVNAENGSVLMFGKDFYYGDFTAGTELTLTTEGNEGYETFLGWYRIDWGKGKEPEYILLSTETTLVYTVPDDYSELVAKWSDGTEEKYHDILAADNGYCFIRSEYEGLAVSAVRIGGTGEIIIVKDPTVTYKLFTAWHLTGTNDDDTAFETSAEVNDYGSWFYVEETYPTVITVAGEITLCADGEHTMDEGEIVVEPTYVKNGVKRYVCAVCGWHTDQPVPMLERYCVHACSVCGGCTLSLSDEACGYNRCTCAEKAELTLKNIQPISFRFNGAEKNIKPKILNVAYESDTDNPYVGFVFKALGEHKVETIYDISLSDGNDKEYTPANGESFTVTLNIGADNVQAMLDGRMYLAHITDNGNEFYGLGRKAFTADVVAGTIDFSADSCSPFVLVSNVIEYYGRAALSKLSNADALLYAYDKISEDVEASAAEISVYNGTDTITQPELETVLDAYRRDRTEHFWLGNACEIISADGTVTSVKPEYIMSGDELETAKAAFNAAAEALLAGITSDMSEYEREKLLHDRLAAAVSYEETANAHNAYGALVGGKAVCEGYAKAYHYLLQLAGLQSFIVNGTAINSETGNSENHAWNLVRIDGEYYNVDLTWDDQDELISYAYFNKTDLQTAEDHSPAATDIALPECTAKAADYFSVNGGELPAFDSQAVAELLSDGGGTARVYVTGSTSEFITAFTANLAALAQKLGLKGNIVSSFTALGREFILTVYSTGFTVNGTVTSFGEKTDEITVQLIKSSESEPAYQTVITGNSAKYTLNNIEEGAYTVNILKNGHVTEVSYITLDEANITLDKTLYLRGDINTDSLCNSADLVLLKRLLIGADEISNTARYDIKEDGSVDILDLVRLKKKTAQY